MNWHISLFLAGARDACPRGVALDRAGLVSVLTAPAHCPEKDKRQAWSAARYPAGSRRGYGQVMDVSCLVLDYDGTEPFATGAAPWQQWAHIQHTTWSHREADGQDCYRIVLPLQQPVPRETFARLWLWADLRSGHAIDRSCKDPCRLWFLPSVRRTSWPYEAKLHEGMLLDWRKLELPVIAVRPKAKPLPPIQCAPADVDKEIKRRLIEDEDSRARMATALGATVVERAAGPTAIKVVCPKCGDRSAWFLIRPSELRRAKCNHGNSCGWTGHLWELAR